MNDFAVFSPYLVPASMRRKKVNLGDGFILRAIERQIGPFKASRIFTSRASPDIQTFHSLREAKTVILGGANQLDNKFSVWPGATAKDMRNSNLAFVPFGIGLNGEPEKNTAFTENTCEVIDAIHERIAFSSWRCGQTVALLEKTFSHLKGRFLMTGCPVLYDEPLLNGSRFFDGEKKIAVTVTERGDFWDRETALLRFVARQFPTAEKNLVLHQVFEPSTAFEERLGPWPGIHLLMSKRARLRILARRLGFNIVAPSTADDCISFYDEIDLHMGSRLHAHLLFLSRNKRSFLVPVDGRSTGFAEFLGFPLVDYRDPGRHLDFDFEIIRDNARLAYETMRTFLSSLKPLGSS